MRRAGGLYDRIADPDNLRLAYLQARRGKQDRHAVRRYGTEVDDRLRELREGLLSGQVTLRGYRFFQIHDPKPRRIAAPEFGDRVLHHAIMNVIEPELERVAIFDSYACRRGKGLYRAVSRAQQYCRQHAWFLQLDVRKFFDSVDHAVLEHLLARRFKDARLLKLLGTIRESYCTEVGKGLPIGSLTSQHLANFYLAPLDHFVKESLRLPGYVRYMDDFVLFADEREELVRAREAVYSFLGERLRLACKNPGALDRTERGIGYLGMLVRGSHVRLMAKSKRRLRRRLRSLVARSASGIVADDELALRVEALLVRTRHCRARGLRARWKQEFAGSVGDDAGVVGLDCAKAPTL